MRPRRDFVVEYTVGVKIFRHQPVSVVFQRRIEDGERLRCTFMEKHAAVTVANQVIVGAVRVGYVGAVVEVLDMEGDRAGEVTIPTVDLLARVIAILCFSLASVDDGKQGLPRTVRLRVLRALLTSQKQPGRFSAQGSSPSIGKALSCARDGDPQIAGMSP